MPKACIHRRQRGSRGSGMPAAGRWWRKSLYGLPGFQSACGRSGRIVLHVAVSSCPDHRAARAGGQKPGLATPQLRTRLARQGEAIAGSCSVGTRAASDGGVVRLKRAAVIYPCRDSVDLRVARARQRQCHHRHRHRHRHQRVSRREGWAGAAVPRWLRLF